MTDQVLESIKLEEVDDFPWSDAYDYEATSQNPFLVADLMAPQERWPVPELNELLRLCRELFIL